MFGVVSPRHRYAVGDLSQVVPGAEFVVPLREDRSAAAVEEDYGFAGWHCTDLVLYS